jgi:hypothetical protein
MDEPTKPETPGPEDKVAGREWAKALIFVVVVGAAATAFVIWFLFTFFAQTCGVPSCG